VPVQDYGTAQDFARNPEMKRLLVSFSKSWTVCKLLHRSARKPNQCVCADSAEGSAAAVSPICYGGNQKRQRARRLLSLENSNSQVFLEERVRWSCSMTTTDTLKL
jgi:hypothetical protein